MDSEKGRALSAKVWTETRDVLVSVSPEAKRFYEELAAGVQTSQAYD